MRLHPIEHLLDVSRVGAVAAQETMLAQEPYIAGEVDGICRRLGNVIRVSQPSRTAAGERKDLVLAKPDKRQVETEAFEIAELQRQQFRIPACV